MTTTAPVPPTWLEKRRQRRKKVIFTRSVITIIILILLTLLLSAIGLLFTVQGGTILAVVAIIATLVAWLFPSPSQTALSQNAAMAQTASLQVNSVPPIQVPQNYRSIFHFATKLSDHKNLYGRETERHTLINRTRQKNSTSLIGPRRIGKSWLIEYLLLVAPTELGSEYLVVSIDVTSARCDTVAGFAEYILSELREEASNRQNALEVLELELDLLAKEKLKPQPNILVVLERAIQNLSRTGAVPIVCIDEFTGLFDRMERKRYRVRKREFDISFFRSLRVMCTSKGMNLVLVIASQETLKKIVGQAGHASGFFNIFYQITIRPFTQSEAEEFVETKGNQALFTDIERNQVMKLGMQGRGTSRVYWPARLELIGEMILYDKVVDSIHYQPQNPRYWKQLKERMEERYHAVF